MLRQIRPAIVMIVLLTVLTGLVYPLAMTGIAQARLSASGQRQPDREGRQGDRLRADRPELHRRQVLPRPALGDDGHRPERCDQDGAGALQRRQLGGRNAGPTSKALIDRVKGDAEKLKAENPDAPVPVDLVTTSASGLDPDITPAAALFQVPRVAKARGLPEAQVRELVAPADRRPLSRRARRAAGQRAEAQPGARRFAVAVTSLSVRWPELPMRRDRRPTRC